MDLGVPNSRQNRAFLDLRSLQNTLYEWNLNIVTPLRCRNVDFLTILLGLRTLPFGGCYMLVSPTLSALPVFILQFDLSTRFVDVYYPSVTLQNSPSMSQCFIWIPVGAPTGARWFVHPQHLDLNSERSMLKCFRHTSDHLCYFNRGLSGNYVLFLSQTWISWMKDTTETWKPSPTELGQRGITILSRQNDDYIVWFDDKEYVDLMACRISSVPRIGWWEDWNRNPDNDWSKQWFPVDVPFKSSQ